MAIIDASKKPFIEDRDDRIFIGIDMPFRKSNGQEGYFASTTTTIDAVKNNIRNLVQTNKGERFMQPSLGIELRKYLFEQFTDESRISIENDITDALNFWLPFVEIKKLIVAMDEEYDVGRNKLKIDITFNINKDPNTLSSVQIDIGE